MATFYGSTFAGTALAGAAQPASPHGSLVGAKLRCTTEVITFAGQASGSDFPLAKLPAGAKFKGVRLTLDTSTGAATLAIGVAGATAKYAAAAALTTADTPTVRAKASGMAQAPLAAEEIVLLTTGGAALPANGTLVVETYFTAPA